jgi:hypothetical protein
MARAKGASAMFEIGSRSLIGSYNGRFFSSASVICVLDPPSRMV